MGHSVRAYPAMVVRLIRHRNINTRSLFRCRALAWLVCSTLLAVELYTTLVAGLRAVVVERTVLSDAMLKRQVVIELCGSL